MSIGEHRGIVLYGGFECVFVLDCFDRRTLPELPVSTHGTLTIYTYHMLHVCGMNSG